MATGAALALTVANARGIPDPGGVAEIGRSVPAGTVAPGGPNREGVQSAGRPCKSASLCGGAPGARERARKGLKCGVALQPLDKPCSAMEAPLHCCPDSHVPLAGAGCAACRAAVGGVHVSIIFDRLCQVPGSVQELAVASRWRGGWRGWWWGCRRVSCKCGTSRLALLAGPGRRKQADTCDTVQ